MSIDNELFDFRVFAKTFLKIKTKQGDIIPFSLNVAQEKLLQVIEQMIAQGRPIRIIILKARQMGLSTLTQAYIFWRLIVTPMQKCLTLAHKMDASNNLFDMYSRYYEYMPEFLKPELEANNEKKIKYKKLQSENKIASAEGHGVGRSDTFQFLHCSEIAFYRNAKDTMLDLLQSAKYAKMIIIESTANGLGDEFYNRWKDAESGDSAYYPLFLSWVDFPEYSETILSIEEREKIANSLTDREKELAQTHGATLEQIKWRRSTLKNECGNDEDKFNQEYPTTPADAFVTSGRPVLPANLSKINYELSTDPILQGDLTETKDGRVLFVPNPRGYIKIFEPIQLVENEYNRFAGGCDVAEGLAQGDYSVISVLDRRTMKVCLEWHGHIDPDLLANEQLKIQKFLKSKIYFATEKNNHGLTTITSAYKLKVRQYYRQDFKDGGYPEDTAQIGWVTNPSTKPYAINNLSEYIRENLFEYKNKEFWSEALTFVRDEKGRMSAQGKSSDASTKCYDDRIMSVAIMLMCHAWMPNYHVRVDDLLPTWAKKKKLAETSDNSFMSV